MFFFSVERIPKNFLHKYLYSVEITQVVLTWREKDDGRLPSKCKVLVTQSCPTPCDLMDCSPPGSSVHGIFQARILEWIAIPFSRGSSQSKDQTGLPHFSLILYHLSHREAQGNNNSFKLLRFGVIC